jgi:hypothetical protein
MMADLLPSYPYTLLARSVSMRDTTGINRTDGPDPPEKLLATDRATMDKRRSALKLTRIGWIPRLRARPGASILRL